MHRTALTLAPPSATVLGSAPLAVDKIPRGITTLAASVMGNAFCAGREEETGMGSRIAPS